MEPVAQSNKSSAIRDFFLYLTLSITFYIVMYDAVSLLFSYVNKLYPDGLDYGDSFISQIRWKISSLFVVFPVHLGLAWFVRRDLNTHGEKINYPLRKLYIYFTLFLSAGFLIGDLIAFINGFLDGDLTARFLLKILIILISAAFTGWFFWNEIKRESSAPPSKFFAVITSTAITLILATGLYLGGSPNSQRQYRLDSDRVNDIMEINQVVIQYLQSKKNLPNSIQEIEDIITSLPADPETNKQYEYRKITDNRFELCTVFNLASPDQAESKQYGYSPRNYYRDDISSWRHPAGHYCYTFDVRNNQPDSKVRPNYESVPVPVK